MLLYVDFLLSWFMIYCVQIITLYPPATPTTPVKKWVLSEKSWVGLIVLILKSLQI